ncbi:capsule biosynthesis GfcC D2 domain-containing protein [Deefgea rivuli]|uniref:capsule biosynthesis GfcC D2 domain-containing protein n=1 Tax=Deefgea rivuli TaxID=400948 RepID=UPI00146FB7CD|nr:capsule biosynthesis GfcC D2 domain-containing protein [Deefgea rivuli]
MNLKFLSLSVYKSKYIFVIFSSLLILGAHAGILQVNEKSISYADGAKLEVVVDQLLIPPLSYWPATYIRNANSQNDALLLKNKILEQLSQLDQKNKGVLKLRRDIERFKPFGRININLDPDWIRLRPTANPRLIGDYQIQLRSRPKTIEIIGLTAQSQTLRFNAKVLHSGLVDRDRYQDWAELNFIYVISPDGQISRIDNAYWNYREVDILPGSFIYIPISSNQLPDSMENINDDIAQLLAAGEEGKDD